MNLEDNKKAFMELLRIPSVTGSGADGEEKACAFLEHILQENGIKTSGLQKTCIDQTFLQQFMHRGLKKSRLC